MTRNNREVQNKTEKKKENMKTMLIGVATVEVVDS
jgi:hypothetical protein